jgi:poly-gamma-glutamate synthesis protein (capsule biosynthesis protein)
MVKPSQSVTETRVFPTATPLPEATATPKITRVWLPEYLPEKLVFEMNFGNGVEAAALETDANTWVMVQSEAADGVLFAEWVYTVVAPFPTIPDEVSLDDVQAAWRGMPASDLPFDGLLVSSKTRTAFEKVWGPAAPFVKTVREDQMVDRAWSEKSWWALVPFEQIEPRWKVIVVDGQSPVRKGFNLKKYGLKLRFLIQGEDSHTAALVPETAYLNYDAQKLTTVMLTGVTALVRGTGALMETYGMDYPAQFIGDTLREADILHINNEVPFWKTCPEPYYWEGLVFCSRTKYIQLLEDIGTDVIDLAGDHFKDWGPEAMLFTIDLYKERGWPYYGGGINIKEAQSAARFEHNGNKIAFLGCNAKPKGYSGASETNPGAVHCDFDQLTASGILFLRGSPHPAGGF